ncbi:MAG: hypothetical protein R2777_00565 [Chitinophagales bacterium]
MNYVIVKMPRWNFDKFKRCRNELGLQMKICRRSYGNRKKFSRSYTKETCQSLENNRIGLGADGKHWMKTEDILEGM